MRFFISCFLAGIIANGLSAQDTIAHTIIISSPDMTMEGIPNNNLKKGDLIQVEVSGFNQNLWRIGIESQEEAYSPITAFPSFGGFDLSSLGNLLNKAPEAGPDTAESQLSSMDTLPPLISTLVSELTDHLNASRSLADTLIIIGSEVEQFKSKYYEKYFSYFDSGVTSALNIPNIFTTADQLRNKISNLNAAMNDAQNSFRQFLARQSEEKLKEEPFKSTIEIISQIFQKVETKKAEVAAVISSNEVQKMVLALLQLNTQADKYTSLPIQYQGGKLEINIEISPIDSNSRLPNYTTTIHLPRRNSFYVSPGPALWAANIADDDHLAKALINDPNQFQIIDPTSTERSLGPAAIARFGYRLTDQFGVHALVGIGTRFNKSNSYLGLFGGGLSIGDPHSLNLDFGLLTGDFSRLNEAFEDEELVFSTLPTDVLTTENDNAFFLAIGYGFKF